MVYVEYDYTGYGRSLVPVLDAMGGWGLGHDARKSERSDAALMTFDVRAKKPKENAGFRRR